MKRIQLFVSSLLVCVVFVSLTVVSEGEKGEDWIHLFNGKTLEGWEKHGGEAKYHVKNESIVGQSVPNTPNTFLCTKAKFENFELRFEVKVDDELNSGVQVRSGLKNKDRVYGPQVEIEAAPGEAGYIYGEGTDRGWLSDDRKKKKVFKNGEWNQYRVVAKGNRIQTWLNGEQIADLNDDKMRTKGFIGLQVHNVGDRKKPLYVAWRNIKIRKLNGEKETSDQ